MRPSVSAVLASGSSQSALDAALVSPFALHRLNEILIVAPAPPLDYCRVAPSIAPLSFPWHKDNAMNKNSG
jgi:hypothetical protein